MNQALLRLNCRRSPRSPFAGETEAETPHHERNRQRFAALLRRQSASISDDVMNCTGPALPHQLARLRDLRETLALALDLDGLIPDAQRERTDRQLLHPVTVADWAAALEILSRTHRAPAWVNTTSQEIQQINRKLDTLAAMVAGRPGAAAAWETLDQEEGR
jgi:hypothetical protein